MPDALATARADAARLPADPRWRPRSGSSPARPRWSATRCRRCWREAPGLAGDGGAGRRRGASPRWTSSPTGCGGQADDAGEGRDPRLGRRLWEARLWHTLDTELTAGRGPRAGAGATSTGSPTAIRAAAAELVGGPATDETVRAGARPAGRASTPTTRTIVDLAKLTLAEATDFVREHDLVSLVDDPCVIQEMPEFARGVAVAYCDSPGPLETADVPTFYCIAPTPADWSPERVESFYREYNDHMIRNLTVHEAMPGHFLQLAHSRRFRGSTRVRALGRVRPVRRGLGGVRRGGDGRARLRRAAGPDAAAQDAAPDDHQRDPRPGRCTATA